MKPLKIAVIGGGSTYTPELVDGFIRYHDELPVESVYLQDIDRGRLDIVGGLSKRMLDRVGIPIYATTDRAEALDGADFVITQLRVGGMAARALDERIPLKFGVIGQETTGPGGFAKALRTVPVMLEIARDIERLAPQAWLINFTNPSGLITEALLRHSQVRAIGLCNVPINMQRQAAQVLGVAPERIELDYVGLNHLSWARHVWLDGEDVTARLLESGGAWGDDQFALSWLKELGMIPNYYLRYYVHRDRVLAEEQSATQTRAEYLQQVEADLLKMYTDPALDEKPALLNERGGAFYSTAAVELIRAIAQDRREVHIVNVRNGEALPDLPPECAVEVPAVIGKSGAHPLTAGRLPATLRGLVAAVKAYEELTIEAAVTGDEGTAQLALLAHPLVPSWDVAVALWQALKTAHRAYLPQFK
ncbi:MAG: 6-phospho-beta-glucosidase [Anaerolineae bacterium]|nr:6-phospho-beta-glucosidase [Anaerolineae bacterium]